MHFIVMCGVIASVLISTQTIAAPLPNSGSLYRQIKDDSLRDIGKGKGQPETEISVPDQITYDDTHQLHVNGFKIVGNTRLSENELHHVMQPFTNRLLNTSALHEAASTLMRYYRNQGYFAAKVYIPPHSIHEGIVILHVYEGYLEDDGIELENSGDRVKDNIITKLLTSTLKPGIIIKEDYERAILLANDLPGITARGILYPGREVGDAGFLLQTHDEDVFQGNLDYDNFGDYYTGEHRFGTTLYLNSPTKNGEELVFRFVTTGEYSNFGYVDLAVPVSDNDMRIGASFDYYKYKLDHEFRDVGAEGDAFSARVYVKYPFVRTRHNNVHSEASYIYTRMTDETDAGELADRVVHTGVFGLHGDHDDDFLANGVTYFDSSLTVGYLDLDGNDAYEDFDDMTAETAGSFARLNVSLSRLQHLYGNLSSNISVSGQIANKNLDTSQKFYLGGPYSVGGYPTGQAGGDHGALLNADLRYDFYDLPWKGNLQLSAFYAYGWTKLHKDPWDGWEGNNDFIKNDIVLQSVGLTLTQTWSDTMVVRAMLGRQIGNNDTKWPDTGEARDRSDSDYRFWINTIFYF